MNCFSAFAHNRPRWFLLVGFLVAACGVPTSESADPANTREYSVHYTLTPDPAASGVNVSLQLKQPRGLVRELSFAIDDRIEVIRGDGELRVRNGRVGWLPPSGGGALEWRVTVYNERSAGSFDALLTAEWGIFRAEDVIPRARTRTLKGAESRTTLAFDLPTGWSAVSEYSALTSPMLVERPGRRFDEPAGWIAMGKLGVRHEKIAGVSVAVAAPQGQNVRRMDILALLNWTLPELISMLPDSLPRLTIVSAGEPMWRGGLSAPASLFLHADRPLISENATSSLLHEVMHTALGVRAQTGFDWITEGLAEYYSIELLRRGNAITRRRASTAFERQTEWARSAGDLCVPMSTGATTALAVTIFRELDRELTEKSDGEVSLDDLLPVIAGQDVDLASLIAATDELIGSTPDALHSDKLPGCRNITAGTTEN